MYMKGKFFHSAISELLLDRGKEWLPVMELDIREIGAASLNVSSQAAALWTSKSKNLQEKQTPCYKTIYLI